MVAAAAIIDEKSSVVLHTVDWLRNEVSAVSRSYRKKKYAYVGYSQVASSQQQPERGRKAAVLALVDQSG